MSRKDYLFTSESVSEGDLRVDQKVCQKLTRIKKARLLKIRVARMLKWPVL